MFLCAPPFIKVAGGGGVAHYEFDITIGGSGGSYGYGGDTFGYGSISDYDDVFAYIIELNQGWNIAVKSTSPVIPATGGDNHFSVFIVSGASTTGVYLPDTGSPISLYYGNYFEIKPSTIDMNTSGTCSLIVEFAIA